MSEYCCKQTFIAYFTVWKTLIHYTIVMMRNSIARKSILIFIEAATRKTLLLKSKKRQEPIVLSNEATKN